MHHKSQLLISEAYRQKTYSCNSGFPPFRREHAPINPLKQQTRHGRKQSLAGRMSLEKHQQKGDAIRALLASRLPLHAVYVPGIGTPAARYCIALRDGRRSLMLCWMTRFKPRYSRPHCRVQASLPALSRCGGVSQIVVDIRKGTDPCGRILVG
ncbi:hypothetical protein M8818_004926 [Zalaria obscura]|uniref:Uncharacterized protein n=1 Tax=Zalaria obscura TaxID=2024903 RepID=A0ACC3SET5_9PEZI